MKKFLFSIVLAVFLVACNQQVTDIKTESSTPQPTEIPVAETVSLATQRIKGDAPEYAKELLYDLIVSNMLFTNWDNPDQLYPNKLYDFYEYSIVNDNKSRLKEMYGTIPLRGSEYIAIPAEVFDQYICTLFGYAPEKLKQNMWGYVESEHVYAFRDYSSNAYFYDAEITNYTEDNGILTVDYTAIHYDDTPFKRIMKAVQIADGWQYLSNNFDYTAPQTEPYPIKNMNGEQLIDYAMTLAEHISEYSRTGNYQLADVKPENISILFSTMYMYISPNHGNRTIHPYTDIIHYSGSDCYYQLNRAQMVAYQLFGFENWYVPSTDYDMRTMTYSNPTEIGWGFGPVAREISAKYITNNKIQVDILAENMEAEEKYNFTIYFDVITENNITFLRFSEMVTKNI